MANTETVPAQFFYNGGTFLLTFDRDEPRTFDVQDQHQIEIVHGTWFIGPSEFAWAEGLDVVQCKAEFWGTVPTHAGWDVSTVQRSVLSHIASEIGRRVLRPETEGTKRNQRKAHGIRKLWS